MKKSNFIYGSIILAGVNFIVRLIGFSYRIILSKLIGPEGIGLFQMVFPVLMVFITITTAGIPVAVSKLVAKQNSIYNYNGTKKIFKVATILTLLISLLLSSILLVFGKYISYEILENENILYSIYFLAPAIIVISLSSVIRGFYYGLKKIAPAGIAQIIEQLTRIVFVLSLIHHMYPLKSQAGAFIAVCGITVGEIFGLIWLVFNYRIIKFKDIKSAKKLKTFKILSQISYISIPITISRIVNVSMQLINAILIPQRLIVSGLSNQEAIETFGRLVGMSMPLIFLPFIVTSALVINIIPNLSEELELKKFKTIRENISLSIRITLVISIPITAVYIFFSDPLALFFYDDITVGRYIGILGYSTVFLSLHHTLSGILHGLGKQVITTINYLVGMTVQVVAVYFLVANPRFGIYGFFIGFIVSIIIICILDYIAVNKFITFKINYFNFILKPMLASAIMIIIIFIIRSYLVSINAKEYITIIGSFLGGGLFYLLILFITKGLPLYLIKRLTKGIH
ncbi:MAG: polysaccharide biosynthesis protein [Firmicutes bacterium]|nr:polysaccharide biosynthesis protein [Bacillota bacterium]